MNACPTTRNGSRTSKGARKRQMRRSERIAAEIAAGNRAEALRRRVLEGLHEVRRRGHRNLEGGAFPFVDELLWDIAATFGGRTAESVRPTLEHEAALAVARATGNPVARSVGGYRAVEEGHLREIRAAQ